MINKEMLLDIFHLPAMSSNEILMQNYIQSFLKKHTIPFEEDERGNIFHFDGAKPLLIAHMDTVQDEKDVILANFIKIRGDILSGYGVIGGDDKCGIYIILELLKEGYDINFAFVVEEEIGGHGSFYLAMNKQLEIETSLYSLVLDRRSDTDIICYQNDYGSKAFENQLEEIGKKYNYTPNRGTFSDADQINHLLSAANLSVGYYNAHSKTEFVILSHLEKALNYTRDIIENVRGHYEAPFIPYHSRTSNKKKKTGGYHHPSGYWDDEYWDYLTGDYEEPNNVDTMCVFCGDTKRDNLRYLKNLKAHVCNDCIVTFYEDTYDVANNFLSDEEIDALYKEFSM